MSGRDVPVVVRPRRLHQADPAPRGALSPTSSIFNPLTVVAAEPPAPERHAAPIGRRRRLASRTPIG